MLTTHFSALGTCMMFLYSNCFMSAGTTSLLYLSFSLGICQLLTVHKLAAFAAFAYPLAFRVHGTGLSGFLVAFRANQHDLSQCDSKRYLHLTELLLYHSS